MSNKKILIVGLPDAGKTTYIAALNGAIRQKPVFSLTYAGKPSNEEYLNKITKLWLEGKEVDHSTDDEIKNIEMPLKRVEDGQEIHLTIPDMKGEFFRDIVVNDIDEGLMDYFKDVSGILFFINKVTKLELKDHLKKTLTGHNAQSSATTTNGDNIKLDVTNMSELAKNILVLKYLREKLGEVKIVIAISAWDKYMATFQNISSYVQSEMAGLYNYVREHYSARRYYGVSAQGFDYKTFDGDIDDVTTNSERAFVYVDEKDFDLSKPILYLTEDVE